MAGTVGGRIVVELVVVVEVFVVAVGGRCPAVAAAAAGRRVAAAGIVAAGRFGPSVAGVAGRPFFEGVIGRKEVRRRWRCRLVMALRWVREWAR